MDFGLLDGLGVALEPWNLMYAFIGALVGSIVGVLPGIGPLLTMALLLPLTYGIDPTGGLIMLAGIYYGAMYGGSTTSIMLNLPGENASVITAIDGYQLRLKGRAGAALGMAAISSFVAGVFAVSVMAFLAEPMTRFALALGVPETFVLLSMALILVSVLSEGSMKKALIMTCLGLLTAIIGTEVLTGRPRFIMGFSELLSGLEMVPVVIGLFAVGEVLNAFPAQSVKPATLRFGEVLPSLDDYKRSAVPVARASVVGLLLGLLPGTGPTVASYVTYGIERALAKDRSRFGRGAIEGVAAPEAANNAASTGALIPLLTLGIPGSAAAAVLLSAFILYGLQPGPTLFANHPDIAWGLIASMFIGNVMLLILNLPLVGIFIQILRLPYPLLSVMTILLATLGAYSINSSVFDVWVVIVFGMLGWLARRLRYPLAPFVLAFVLGEAIETTFRQSLLLSDDGVLIFFHRTLSLTLILSLVLAVVAIVGLRFVRRRGGAAVSQE